jgi:hypothetical protein
MNRDLEDLGGADPYELLGVAPDADTADIECAYRRMARRTHPDAGGDEESQKRLNLAREVLLDPGRRREIDRRLRQRRGEEDKITEEPSPPQPEPVPYENLFDWTHGTGPDPPQTPPAQDVAPEPEPSPPQPEPVSYQFDWTHGTGTSQPPPSFPPPAPHPPYQWRAYPEPAYWRSPYQQPGNRRSPYWQPTGGYPAPRNRLAIASLVMAFVFWPAALPMAVIALDQMRHRNERGAGLAWTAIALPILGLMLLWFVLIGARPGPAGVQPSGPPAGCPQAIAAINTYYQTVGSTWYSAADAAERAENEIGTAEKAADYSGPVSADLNALYIDFGTLYEYAIEEYSSGYDTVSTQTNVNARQLETDCNTG